MAETRNVKVTTKDIDSVSEKLNTFAKQLSPGEQNVMAWLLGRAAEAPPDKGSLREHLAAPAASAAAPAASAPATGTAAKTTVTGPVAPSASLLTKRVNLDNALGIAQFTKSRPGTLAAGSSIGVTGTIMF